MNNLFSSLARFIQNINGFKTKIGGTMVGIASLLTLLDTTTNVTTFASTATWLLSVGTPLAALGTAHQAVKGAGAFLSKFSGSQPAK